MKKPRNLFERGTSKPGEFAACCDSGTRKLYSDCSPEELARVDGTARFDRKFDGDVVDVLCGGLEFNDSALFEAHMYQVHGAKPGQRPAVQAASGWERISRPPMKVRPWRGPRLTEDGKPFEPVDLEPGATVIWRELVPTGETYIDGDLGQRAERPVREWVERSGQVWDRAWRPKSAWVIPFDKRPGETAVMVETRYGGSLEHYSTVYSDNADVKAPVAS